MEKTKKVSFNKIILSIFSVLLILVISLLLSSFTANIIGAKNDFMQANNDSGYQIKDIFDSTAIIKNTENAGIANKVENPKQLYDKYGNPVDSNGNPIGANGNSAKQQNNGLFNGLFNKNKNNTNESNNNSINNNNNNGNAQKENNSKEKKGFLSGLFGNKKENTENNVVKDGQTKLKGFWNSGTKIAKNATQKTANTLLLGFAGFLALISIPITIIVIIFSIIRDGIFGMGKKKDEKKGHKTRKRILIFFLLAQILPLILVLIIKGWG